MKNRARTLVAALAGLLLVVAAWAQEKDKLPPPTPLPGSSAVRIVLGPAEASATPYRHGHGAAAQTASGDIQVTQPAPNIVVVNMFGAALAKGHLNCESSAGWNFDLNQEFEVIAPPNTNLKMSLEARVVGQLRSTGCCSHKGNTTAECGQAHASISCGPEAILAIDVPPRSVSCGDNQVVYARAGPNSLAVPPACYVLHQSFSIGAVVQKCPLACKAVVADFAPDRHLNRNYFGLFDPLNGSPIRENGFRVTIRVTPE